jgi:TusA-related sulfurtransferase
MQAEPAVDRPKSDLILDTVGFYCPVPIIKTAAKIREMRAGEVLEVLSDDRVILVDMPAWCKSTGHEYLGHTQEEGELHLYIRKIARGAPKSAP